MVPSTRLAVEEILNYRFRCIDLLDLAVRHASVADARVRSNERLEFLGDAVLGMVVCAHIYQIYPDLLEGEMTKIKSAVVSRTNCATMAKKIGLVQHLQLGKGMRAGSGHLPVSLAAAILESIVGAIYVDGGLEPAERFLVPLVRPCIAAAFESGHQENYKSLMQQHAQQHGLSQPMYLILSQSGPDHSKLFEICVQIGEQRFAPMTGASKKSAEQAAALAALRHLGLLSAEPALLGTVTLTSPETPMPGSAVVQIPEQTGADAPLSDPSGLSTSDAAA